MVMSCLVVLELFPISISSSTLLYTRTNKDFFSCALVTVKVFVPQQRSKNDSISSRNKTKNIFVVKLVRQLAKIMHLYVCNHQINN